MTLRKVTIDNSVRYIPKNEPNVMKKSLPREQNEQTQSISKGDKHENEKFFTNSKNFFKHFAAGRFGMITK